MDGCAFLQINLAKTACVDVERGVKVLDSRGVEVLDSDLRSGFRPFVRSDSDLHSNHYVNSINFEQPSSIACYSLQRAATVTESLERLVILRPRTSHLFS